LAHIEYPGLPREEALDAVHRFYDEYYFRPKAIFRIVRKAFFDNSERKRLYKEAKAFLKLRAARSKYVKDRRDDASAAPPPSTPASRKPTTVQPAQPGGHPDLIVLPTSSERSGQPIVETL
jgi:hypothetical protein